MANGSQIDESRFETLESRNYFPQCSVIRQVSDKTGYLRWLPCMDVHIGGEPENAIGSSESKILSTGHQDP